MRLLALALVSIGCASVPPPQPVASAAAPAPAPARCLELPEALLLGCPQPVDPAPPRADVLAALDTLAREAAGGSHPGTSRRSRRSAPEPSLAPRSFTEDEAHAVHLLHLTRCALPPSDPERATFVYRLARLYYQANQFSEAYVYFDEVVRAPRPEPELVPFATALALDSLNLRLRDTEGAAHDACLAEFVPAIARYHARICEPAPLDLDTCEVLEMLARQLGE